MVLTSLDLLARTEVLARRPGLCQALDHYAPSKGLRIRFADTHHHDLSYHLHGCMGHNRHRDKYLSVLACPALLDREHGGPLHHWTNDIVHYHWIFLVGRGCRTSSLPGCDCMAIEDGRQTEDPAHGVVFRRDIVRLLVSFNLYPVLMILSGFACSASCAWSNSEIT